mmetsp:Transcript_25638/g.59083  ORF Transcript_25638/g.59083 Transcript_25638/m.59083 type:complete len:181 (+) Transcript_25638:279-821(+)
MVATGNPLHANVYAVYLVHEKAVLRALLNEPRYLGMNPDLVKVDLLADETSSELRALFAHSITASGKSDTKQISLMSVISAIKGCSFVENPVLYTKEDGTQVTNFHEGLAKWAGTSDSLRGSEEYLAAVEVAIRKAEAAQEANDPLYCVGEDTLRFNQAFTLAEFRDLAASAGVPYLGSG